MAQPAANVLIADANAARKAIAKLRSCSLIGVDFEWDSHSENDRLSLIQIKDPSRAGVYIFDVLTCPQIITNMKGGLTSILCSDDIVKVFHDCRQDARVLLKNGVDIPMRNVFDVQIGYAICTGLLGEGDASNRSHEHVHADLGFPVNPYHVPHAQRGFWLQRPLSPNTLNYAAADVRHLCDIYRHLKERLAPSLLDDWRQQSAERLLRPVSNIIVSDVVPVGSPSCLLGEAYTWTFTIRKSGGNQQQAHLRKINFMQNLGRPLLTVQSIVDALGRPVRLPHCFRLPGDVLTVTVRFSSKSVATLRSTVQFSVGHHGEGEGRKICKRMLQVRATRDPALLEKLAPETPYKKPRRPPPKKRSTTEIVPGEGPPGSTTMTPYAIRPGIYPIPKEWRSKSVDDRKSTLERLSESKHRSPKDFSDYCHHLLWTEELQMEEDIHLYDIPSVQLDTFNSFLVLTVPGLAEKRPSVLRGDHVLARRLGSGGDASNHPGGGKVTLHQGYAHEVQLDKIKLRFNKIFHAQHVPGHKYSVEFTFPRSVIRICHQAVDIMANKMRTPAGNAVQALTQLANDFFESFINPNAAGGGGLSPMIAAVVDPTSPAVMDGLVRQQQSIAGVAAAPLQFYNRDLNVEQRRAVDSIVCKGAGRAFPYLIYGPPGTGKTMTVVEVVKQLWKAFYSAREVMIIRSTLSRHPIPTSGPHRILVCAPSNTAADLLLQRLAPTITSPAEMFRLNSFQRERMISADLEKYCMYDLGSNGYVVPEKAELEKYPLIVATCIMAGKLINFGFKDYFDAVVVDEAGHAVEAEIMATFAGLLKPGGQIVLAGDPQQLGPVVHSTAAATWGLSTSMLERLMTSGDAEQPVTNADTDAASQLHRRPVILPNRLSPYSRDLAAFPENHGYNPIAVTKLVKCYRCHPDIIRFPNQFFYNNDLVSVADPVVSHSLCRWSELPALGFPVIFHGVEGENLREGSSPSWFNIQEVEIVIEYIEKLLETRAVQDASKIAVITPYRQQVKKLRVALGIESNGARARNRNRGNNTNAAGNRFADIVVGSCEQLQGQEFQVVIISTVRTDSQQLEMDAKFNLGFVSSPKRFNVAITRAQALLVIIGDPRILKEDKHWGTMLRFCAENGSYVGAPLDDSNTPDPEESSSDDEDWDDGYGDGRGSEGGDDGRDDGRGDGSNEGGGRGRVPVAGGINLTWVDSAPAVPAVAVVAGEPQSQRRRRQLDDAADDGDDEDDSDDGSIDSFVDAVAGLVLGSGSPVSGSPGSSDGGYVVIPSNYGNAAQYEGSSGGWRGEGDT